MDRYFFLLKTIAEVINRVSNKHSRTALQSASTTQRYLIDIKKALVTGNPVDKSNMFLIDQLVYYYCLSFYRPLYCLHDIPDILVSHVRAGGEAHTDLEDGL